MGNSEILIRCENASKKFCRDLKKSLWYGIKDLSSDLYGGRKTIHRFRNGSRADAICDIPAAELRPDEFWAVNDASFEIKRGDCVGLIGRNGAGKTTLLKLLNGIIKPDRGRIELKGRVGALIALGAGFSPVLTGRENVYINGSILGLRRREINDKFDAIVDFAELGEFIDAPVQSYSSGMRVRLGFAVAAMLIKPDILLLDEVLAVGDRSFIARCVNIVRELMATSAVVLVSHNMRYISNFCNRAILMESGQMALDAHDISTAIERYSAMVPVERRISETSCAKFHHASVNAATVENRTLNSDAADNSVKLRLSFELVGVSGPCNLMLILRSANDEPILNVRCTDAAFNEMRLSDGAHSFDATFSVSDLNFDQYTLDFLVREEASKIIHLRVNNAATFQIVGNGWGPARISRRAVCHPTASAMSDEA